MAPGRVSTEKLRSSVASYLGYLKHCESHRTIQGILDELTVPQGSPA